MPLNVASVSYLNSKPLVYGLADDPSIDLRFAVPSALLAGLADGSSDVALLPTIDYQRLNGGRILLAGDGSGGAIGSGIGCDGPTLTVRLFGRRPLAETTTLACDVDSHTSVALARIVLAEGYGVRPELAPLRADATGGDWPDTFLLIGDKVIASEPPADEFPHQVDLGGAWKQLTGLPFVFAAWTARPGVDVADLPARLERAKSDGLARVGEIVAREAEPRHWPADVARRYLTESLKFDVRDRQLEAIRTFHRKAASHGLIGPEVRDLRVARGAR